LPFVDADQSKASLAAVFCEKMLEEIGIFCPTFQPYCSASCRPAIMAVDIRERLPLRIGHHILG